MREQGLPRAARIKDRRDFSRLRLEGKRVVRSCFVANWKVPGAGEGSRLGVVTTRKLGSAVDRSRARRLLREAYRGLRSELAGSVDLILVARQGILKVGSREVRGELSSVLARAGLLRET